MALSFGKSKDKNLFYLIEPSFIKKFVTIFGFSARFLRGLEKNILPKPPSFSGSLSIQKEGKEKVLSIEEFEKLVGVSFIPQLDFLKFSLLNTIVEKTLKFHKKDQLSCRQLWLGSYFKKEILNPILPPIALRWIDSQVGWGVFTTKPIKKMEFIGEYAGKVRKRKREDKKNAYCFEYMLAEGYDSPYVIDARDQGGIVRYINHSDKPNLISTLATFDHLSHVILLAKEPIPAGTQLLYDYGGNYWKHRLRPKELSSSQKDLSK